MNHRPLPPRLPGQLARWFLSPDDADRLLDALDDEYVHHQRLERTRIGADLWYWKQVLRSVPTLRRRARERRGGSMLLDLLHLSRTLRRSPVSAGAVVVTMALTIGAGTSIFAVVDQVLLKPPPFANPDALVTVGETATDEPAAAPRAVSYATFQAWRERAGQMAMLEAFDPTNVTLTELGTAERVSATNVTPGFLQLLGVSPVLGRGFDANEFGQPVAIISQGFWRGKMAADPAVIGRELVLDGQPHTIIGVLPERFFFALNACDVWRPLPVSPVEAAREGQPVRVIARLAGRASPQDLAGVLDDVSRTSSPPARVVATPVATAIAGDSTETLGLLAGAAALAMLIAFTNLAVLLIVRSIDRRRELAVRTALGAHPIETVKQLLLEAVAVVALGIVGGVLLAFWMTPTVGRFALEFGGLAHRDVAISWRAISIVGIIALVCACLGGSLPAIRAARSSTVDVLRRGATPSAQHHALRRIFVAGEVALAFVLLMSMALLGRSLLDVLDIDPGFDPRGVLKLQVSLPSTSYPSRERAVSFYSELQSALQERLGPSAVSLVNEVPLTGDGGRSRVSVRRTQAGREAVLRTASPGYFDVMRIPVVAGRSFDRTDDLGAPPRVVITESLAEQLFESEQPIGHRVWLARMEQMAEVIGVTGDVKHRALEEPPLPTIYLSALQSPSAASILVVRSPLPDAAVIATVREEVERLDGDLPVYRIQSMRDVVAASPGVPARRLLTAMLTGFSLLAVVLSAIGLFGVTAHDVASRRAELALRMALGAAPMRIIGTSLKKGALLVGSGLGVGGLLSIWAIRALGGMGFTAGQSHVLGIGAAIAVLLIATGTAAVFPVALDAARSDPLAILRSE